MRVVILGAAGFLGNKLARALLAKGSLKDRHGQQKEITRLVVFAQLLADLGPDKRLEHVTVDITDLNSLEKLIQPQTDVVIHLAAIVSGEAEQNFELGMQVNLHATMALLELCRKLTEPPKFMFASSVAVFGGEMPAVIQDNTAATPLSSYGTQKAMSELLINDYSRKGFIDARVLRFPTIVVRPGKPNAATSTFASSVIREPLQGQEAICPVSADTRLWILSPRQAIRSALQALDMDSSSLGLNRILSLPGITISVEDMVNSLEAVAGKAVIKRIRWEPKAFIQNIVSSWPSCITPYRATELGFEADASMTEIVQNFIEDDMRKV